MGNNLRFSLYVMDFRCNTSVAKVGGIVKLSEHKSGTLVAWNSSLYI